MALDFSQHPCFSAKAHRTHGRIHLPVAPKCNLGCNFCNRRFDCVNESRPGVTSTVLSPWQAVSYLNRVLELVETPISVVGIAGPGDPFANAEQTMQTLRLVRDEHPDMMLCLASNGLGIGPHIDELAALEVSHVTITINAIEPAIGARIYRFVRPQRKPLRGEQGASTLLERQLEAVARLKAAGVVVKVNSIVMPGVNDEHVPAIAERVAELGADVHNCMALMPVEDTPFAELEEPDNQRMQAIRASCGKHVPQMTHCARCRADAVGLLGEDNDELIRQIMSEAAAEPIVAGENRPRVAVASYEGMLVNQHLGQAEQLWIFEPGEAGGFTMVETRPTPLPGSGERRWDQLGERLSDCRSVVCSSAGMKPKLALEEAGVRVQVAEGLIDEALEAVYAGRRPTQPTRVKAAAGCDEDGVGCGGCNGPGTGCG